MFSDVLAALERSQQLQGILLVSGESSLQDLAFSGRTTLIPDITEKGQSPAATVGLTRAGELGCDRALLVPGDCPLIDVREIDELITGFEEFDLVIVPDRHQFGTNALLMNTRLSFEPRFGPDSLALHIRQAIEKGLRYSVEPVASLALDVDTGSDLKELVAMLERVPDRAVHTQALLRQIERTQPVFAQA